MLGVSTIGNAILIAYDGNPILALRFLATHRFPGLKSGPCNPSNYIEGVKVRVSCSPWAIVQASPSSKWARC
jgi:hypothetical protein